MNTLLLLLALLPHATTTLANSSTPPTPPLEAPAPRVALYGLFAPATAPAARAAALAGAAAALSQALGLPHLAPPSDGSGAVEVPSPPALNLQRDDRINVPSRALLVQGARRAFGDLGDARAVALALGHHAAWQRFQASGQPLGLFVVEPESLAPGAAPPAAAAAGAAALRLALGSAGGAWDLLVLGCLVPPQRAGGAAAAAAAAAMSSELAQAGWGAPLRWRGWHAYALTQEGAAVLLREGALPLSQRSEAYASTLVDLGLLRALAPLGGGSGGGGSGGGSSSDASAGGAAPGGAAAMGALFARAEGWGWGGSGGELAHMLVEAPCDLCAVPEDYSRLGHIFLAAGPTALVAGLLTTYLLQATGWCKGAPRAAQGVIAW